MPITTRRTIITTTEAARIYGVTQCRMRQLAAAGELWTDRISGLFVFDRDEVERKAAEMAAARAAGHVRGPAPGGGPAPAPTRRRRRK